MSVDNLDSAGSFFPSWDPLEEAEEDKNILLGAQRRVIRNILKSYVGYFDLLSEPIQNALDAVERRIAKQEENYNPEVSIEINIQENYIVVGDNGTGMTEREFKGFLRPNYSFKTEVGSRGNKGVGATYLAYGFNHLEAATKSDRYSISGILLKGRDWLDDSSYTLSNPRIENNRNNHEYFNKIDTGTVIKVKLGGDNTRPKSLKWIGAKSAFEWMALLRTYTPIGGVYLLGEKAPQIKIKLKLIDEQGVETFSELDQPKYLYPHEEVAQVADLREVIAHTKKQVEKNLPVNIPLKFKSLNGVWGEWSAEQIFGEKNESPINPRFTRYEISEALRMNLKIYIFLAYSTDLWDVIARKYNLRQGERLLRGGLQIATKNMPQGALLTIPLTNNIGFQNQAHVLIHVENVEPDLGRKGFQPETTDLLERLAVSAVTAFRRRIDLLKSPGSAKIFTQEIKVDEWIREQEERLVTHPLNIKGSYLFEPREELPIKSVPRVEQDVVALFNQMLSSGVIRGIEILSSSQYKQYDGLYRINMSPPFERYIFNEMTNPLGVPNDIFNGQNNALRSTTKILEYKHTLDGLVEEIFTEQKSLDEVELAIVWEMGDKWRSGFTITSLLVPEHIQFRNFHGVTHRLNHPNINKVAAHIICLEEMINYLNDRDREIENQRAKYEDPD